MRANSSAPHGISRLTCRIDAEAVHRLTSLGAVVTHVVHATSEDGFDAEWRMSSIVTVKGDLISGCELFDEEDLDAALDRFEELHPHAPRLEHPVQERFLAHFAARDWDAMGQDFADDYYCDDRRRVVNAGVRHGRDAAFEDLRVAAEIGLMTNITSDIIATRGERLFLGRTRWLGPDQRPEDFHTEVLNVVVVDPEERIAAQVLFDPNDIGAAFNELDARYLAGEAPAHAHTWSLVADAFAATNRHELPELSSDWVNVDHRRGAAFGTGEMTAYLHDLFDDVPDIHVYVEVVHRLDNLGAVLTQTGHGTSQEGFQAEWREIGILVFGGDLLSRCELFDERDLDAALARFEELHSQARQLENAASQVEQRFLTYFAARDWDAYAEILSDDVCIDDRRHVVNAGVRHGRDAEIANVRALADIGIRNATSTVIAVRGGRLFLGRHCVRGGWSDSEVSETLCVLEINAENQIVARVLFDADDIDAAFEELEARYLAAEAAAHAHIWTAMVQVQAAFNRHEVPPTTADWVNIDHRRGRAFAPGDMIPYTRATYDVAPNVKGHIEAVHQLNNFGVVITDMLTGTSQEGFAFEWREVALFAFEGDMVCRFELFDEADLDAALARFDELLQAPRLENAASQVVERFWKYFAARHWDAMAETMADDFCTHDRRRVANAGVLHGRAAHITNMRAVAEVGFEGLSSTVIATRGQRLALIRFRTSMRGSPPGEVIADVVGIVEIDADNRLVAAVHFDSDDIDAAFEELEARYLVGQAAAHAHAWSVIARTYAAFNRHEFPSTTPDSVYIDHRPLVTNDASDLAANIRATWELMDVSIYIAESVHRLSELGAVVTQTLKGTSKEGLDVEYRMIDIFTVEGDLLSRCEVFDESDLDAALARFDELQPQARRLENTASQVEQRFLTYFAARDWGAYAEILSDDVCMDDRRHVVNAGVRHGRDAEIASQRAVADVGVTHFTSTVIAIRGRRLALGCYSVFDGWSGSTVLCVSEINAENQIVARVAFDSDDLDAAFEELDARYLAGEAAAHAHTWSVVMQAQAAWNRHEFFPNTEDWVNVDHRRGRAYAPGELKPFLRATWNVIPDAKIHAETVHRLTNAGVVSTVVATGTSQEGFDAEWREIALLTFDGDLVSRCELFDEADLDAALARFDELQPQARRLENAATQVGERFWKHFAARDWDAMAELIADDIFSDDRRRVVNGGVRRGRGDHMADMRGIAEVLPDEVITPTVIATRGARLALTRICGLNRGLGPGEVTAELFSVVELDADNRIVSHIGFDVDDIDAAFEELDARYLAGEATPYANTWSAVAGFYAALNRHEILAAPDWVNVDHRRATTVASGDMAASIRATWDLAPNITRSVEAVHRLDSLGAVVAHTAYGTSQEGFDAEWRLVALLTFTGDLISRAELFDEADLDAALARFDELHTRAPRLENAASQVGQRQLAHFAARDWAAMTELLAEDTSTDDRRRVVNAGNQLGRDVDVATMRALADLGVAHIASAVIATRGERLALTRSRMSGRDQRPDAFYTEALSILEIDADNRGAAKVVFDLDDLDGAFAELDARYLAVEAASHAHTWSVIVETYAAFNRHELPPTTPDWVNIDHRRGVAFAPGDATAYIRASRDPPRQHLRRECASAEQPRGGFHPGRAWDFEGGLRSRVAEDRHCHGRRRSDQSRRDIRRGRPRRRARPIRRATAAGAATGKRGKRSGRTLLEVRRGQRVGGDGRELADDFSGRSASGVGAGVLSGPAVQVTNMRAVADVGFEGFTSTVVATRGQRVALIRVRASVRGSCAPRSRAAEMCQHRQNRCRQTGSHAADLFDAGRHRRRLRGT